MLALVPELCILELLIQMLPALTFKLLSLGIKDGHKRNSKAVDDNLTFVPEIHGHLAPNVALDLSKPPGRSVRVTNQHARCHHRI